MPSPPNAENLSGDPTHITHLYLHISRAKIKMQHEETTRLNCHICHLWRRDGCLDFLGGPKGCDPLRGFLSESDCPRFAPGGPSNWLMLLGKIDRRDTNGRHLIV